MREPELRELLADERRRRPRELRDCPDSAELVAAAAGELEAARRERVAAHVESCPDCAGEYSLARELREWAAEVAATTPAERALPGRLPPARRWLPLAAALAIAVGALVGGERWLHRERDTPRGGPQSSWTVEPPDGARLTVAPRLLSWPPVPGARGYEVVLFDDATRPILRSPELATNRFELPPATALRADRGYYWRVTVLREVGDESSPLFAFQVTQ